MLNPEILNYLLFGLAACALYILRYYLMSGTYYLIVCKVFKKFFWKFKIEKNESITSEIKHDFFYGTTVGIMCIPWAMVIYFLYTHGYTKIYFDLEKYPTGYLALSTFLAFVAHDTYFFWFHYLEHKVPWFAKHFKHKAHHNHRNTSAWSAFAVHPLESFVELGFRPLIICILPLHPYAILIHAVLSFALNVLGHSGYEFFPRGYTQFPLTKFFGNATHHYLHHAHGKYNLGLFFAWWDKIMGTEHPKYHQHFETNAQHHPFALPVTRERNTSNSQRITS